MISLTGMVGASEDRGVLLRVSGRWPEKAADGFLPSLR